jgi:TMEM175 potassium channel family protein
VGGEREQRGSQYAKEEPVTEGIDLPPSGGESRRTGATSSLSRIESFSDGVFAFAATLLALNLVVPGVADVQNDADLWRLLGGEGLTFIAYILSFVFIGEIWISHHRLLSYLREDDHWMTWLNTGLLADVVFIPFATRLLGVHAGHPGQRAAAIVYGAAWTVGGVLFNAIWLYSSHRGRLLRSELSEADRRTITRHWAIGPCLYLVSTLLALVSFWVAATGFLLMSVLYIIPLPTRVQVSMRRLTVWSSRKRKISPGSDPGG